MLIAVLWLLGYSSDGSRGWSRPTRIGFVAITICLYLTRLMTDLRNTEPNQEQVGQC